MTIKEAKIELRKMGMILTREDGEFRVNYRGASGNTAYYTYDIDDAVGTAHLMWKNQPGY